MSDPRDALIRKVQADRDALLAEQDGWKNRIRALEAEVSRRGKIVRALARAAYINDTIGDMKDAADKAMALIGIDLGRLEEDEIRSELSDASLYDIPGADEVSK